MEILRDRAGVPHVYAGSTADLYFGLGFATAQDRLWQLDRLRRRALGRQAEVLGPDYARSDLIHRLVGIEEIARAEAGRLDERTREIVTAYVAGINHHLEQVGASPATLPVEFDLLGYACRAVHRRRRPGHPARDVVEPQRAPGGPRRRRSGAPPPRGPPARPAT